MQLWRPDGEPGVKCLCCWRPARWFAGPLHWCDVHAPKWVRR